MNHDFDSFPQPVNNFRRLSDLSLTIDIETFKPHGTVFLKTEVA